VYQHALATALIEANELDEAEQLLVTVTESLRSRTFATLQRDVAREESFEVYSSARGDVARTSRCSTARSCDLASLYERRHEPDRARTQYARVLEGRSDDVTALAALARLARNDAERERYYADAFEANPFSLTLVRAYQKDLASARSTMFRRPARRCARRSRNSPAARRAPHGPRSTRCSQSFRTTTRCARCARSRRHATIVLPSSTPTASELRALLDGFERLTPAQRVALDQATYTSVAQFRGTAFEAGTIDAVEFRFSEPTVFEGTFDITQPLRLTYRILGVTRTGDRDALLLEPLRLEASR
jgi:hypothetical protein